MISPLNGKQQFEYATSVKFCLIGRPGVGTTCFFSERMNFTENGGVLHWEGQILTCLHAAAPQSNEIKIMGPHFISLEGRCHSALPRMELY